jgi:hypothetical protein
VPPSTPDFAFNPKIRRSRLDASLLVGGKPRNGGGGGGDGGSGGGSGGGSDGGASPSLDDAFVTNNLRRASRLDCKSNGVAALQRFASPTASALVVLGVPRARYDSNDVSMLSATSFVAIAYAASAMRPNAHASAAQGCLTTVRVKTLTGHETRVGPSRGMSASVYAKIKI